MGSHVLHIASRSPTGDIDRENQSLERNIAMTTKINLSPQLENIVRQKIASGKYASVNEVVSEALRLLDERDQIDSVRLENLRKDIHDGMNSGDSVDWNSADIKKAGRDLLSE